MPVAERSGSSASLLSLCCNQSCHGAQKRCIRVLLQFSYSCLTRCVANVAYGEEKFVPLLVGHHASAAHSDEVDGDALYASEF